MKKNNKIIFIVIGVIAVVVVVFLIFSKGSNKEEVYEVGKDIEAGEYVLVGKGTYTLGNVSEKDYGYYEICSTEDCDVSTGGMVDNDNVFGKAYVIVENGQYLKTKSMKLYKVDEYKASVANSISYDYNFGFSSYYKVGKDFSAGTYNISGDNFYYFVCSKPGCETVGVFDTEILSSGDSNSSSTLTVENGQYLVVSGTEPFTITR